VFQRFFTELRAARVPVTLKEYLVLIEALEKDAIPPVVEDFYYLSRAALVKDERNLDKFDRVFGHVFKGLENTAEAVNAEIPAEWLRALTEKFLTDEEKAQIEALGGWDKLMQTLKDRHRRHEPLWQQRLQPRRRAHRRRGRPAPRREGLGQARIQEPRRQRRTRRAQHQDRAPAPAQIRAHRRTRRTRSRRHHR
jgi:uncharacterized protein with von Willebrand factor type A (vWA) domain